MNVVEVFYLYFYLVCGGILWFYLKCFEEFFVWGLGFGVLVDWGVVVVECLCVGLGDVCGVVVEIL